MATETQNVILRTTVNRTIEYLTSGNIVTDATSDAQGNQYYDSKTTAKSNSPASSWRKPLPYSRFVRRIRCPVGTASYVTGTPGTTNYRRVTLTGAFGGSRAAAWDQQFPAGLRQLAEVEALSNLKDQKINLAQAFAERDQTAALLGSTARRLAAAMRSLRRGRFNEAARALGVTANGKPNWRGVPSGWLQLQYGWKPLLGDVFGAAQQLAQAYAVPEAWLVTVKGTSSMSENFETEATYVNPIPPLFRSRTTSSHKCFVRLDYTASSAFMRNLNQLGVSNPLQLAWELVPYSFVVDWCFGVGDWLSALDAASGFDFRSGSRSELSKSRVEQMPVTPSDATYREVRNQCYGGMAERVRLDRFIYTDSPLPSYPRPSFDRFSLKQMADGLSLLATAFQRGKPSGARF